MCYYTITLDHVASNDGHTRAIMIMDAKDKDDAEKHFLVTFGPQYYKQVKIAEGIHIPRGFDRLLTDQVKKYIMKVKTNADDAPPLLSYQNMIKLQYA